MGRRSRTRPLTSLKRGSQTAIRLGSTARKGGRGGEGALLRKVVALAALIGALVVLAPVAQARTDANPVLRVNFQLDGTMAVTLGDGTPVGTKTGAPTVIPAGYYSVLMFGPGGCANVPYFTLKGPGETIVDNMDGGELATNQYNAYFQPNATYTWHSDVDTTIVYTFATNGTVVGAPPRDRRAEGAELGQSWKRPVDQPARRRASRPSRERSRPR